MRVLTLQYQSSASFDRTPLAAKLESQGWRAWLYTMAPHVFSSTFEKFDEDYWDWFWNLLLAKRDGKNLGHLDTELAYLDTLARGLGKSSKAEWSVIMMGCVLGGEVLALYVSSTGTLAEGHLRNIREELESSQIAEYYPNMGEAEVGKLQNRYGWNQALLATKSGLTVFAVGLQEEVRGVKRKNHRPAFIILDEFDSKNDTPDLVKKKESIIGGSIFGTQVEDTIILMAQNLIHAGSVASRTYKRRNELLSRRRESGLIKAFTDDLKIEMVGTRYEATKGKPRYARLSLANFQKYLDTSGPVETLAEYQHEFDRNREGKVLHNYNDLIMVITEDQFFSVYKSRKPPAAWNKYVFNDYARTKSEFHANVGGTLSMSGMNTPLPGVTFLYDCLSFEAATEADDCAIAFLKRISPTVWAQGIEYEWEILLQELIARENIGKFTASLTEKIKAQRQGLARVIPKFVTPLLTSQHYTRFRMSHERDDWQRIYRETFGLPFEPAKPTEGAGVDLINFTMKVDPTVADPFSRVVYDSESGVPRPLMGMSRFYIIVPNGARADGTPWESYPNDNQPANLHGSDLARYQFTEHRYLQPKQNALGEMERGQEKRNDDFINGLQFFYMDHSIQARELTPDEMAEAHMASHLQLASIKSEEDPETREHMMMAREVALKKELYARISKQVGPGARSKPGNRLADFRRMDRYRR